MKGRPVPEEYRRALRLCIGVGLPCLLGYGVILPDSRWAYNKAFAQSCKWAAITVVVVTMPVIGKVGQVGAERTLGTIIGGLLGFLVHAVGSTYWTDESDGVVLSVAAAMVAFSSVVVGSRLKLDLSARLFVITFLLVCFGSQDGRDPLKLAISRIGGIVMGVVISLILSVVVLPKSATMECVHNLEKALQSLSKLNELAWRSHLPSQQKEAAQRPVVAGSGLQQQPSTTLTRSDGYEALPNGATNDAAPSQGASGSAAGGKAAYSKAEFEEYEEQCEKVLTDIYQALFKQQENADLAKAEVLLGSCGDHLVFVPGLPLIGRQSKHMPWEAMAELATCVRRVARLLLTVIATMEGGSFEAQMQTVLGDQYPEGLLQELALAMQDALKSMCRSFPHADTCPHDCLLRLSAAVKKLVGVSDVQRRAIIRALRGGRERRFAQASWQRLIDTVRHQQAAAAAAAPAEQPPSPQSLSAPTSPAARQWQRGGEGDPFVRAESGVAAPAAPAAEAEGSGRSAGLLQASLQSSSSRPTRQQRQRQQAEGEGQPFAAAGLLTGLLRGPGGQPRRGPTSFQSAADQLLAMAAQTRRDLLGHGQGGTGSASTSRTASEAEGLLQNAEGARGTTYTAAAAAAAERLAQRASSSQRGGQQAQPRQPASSSSQTSSPDSPLLSKSYPPGPGGSGDWQAALRPISSEELAQLMGEELEGFDGSPVDGAQGQKVHSRVGPQRSETLRLAMFPETAEGYVAQVRWYSFQFLLEDMLDELVDLHQAMCNTLARLP